MIHLLNLACVFASPAIAEFEIDLANSHPISPYVYGVNFPDWKALGRGFTLVRQGGNRMTAYNWETNASNAGNDYHHQNDGHMGVTNEPGWTLRTFLEAGQVNGAAVLLTIPTAGFVSADKSGDGDVNKIPNYLAARFHKSIASKPGGVFAYPPNTSDKAVYQDECVARLEKIKRRNTPLWYSLDNEPDLWHSTHERITPRKPGYADIIANNIEFASAIKKVAPKTKIFAPANYGWQGFRTFQDAPDAKGRDFLDVYLAALKGAEKRVGKRLLDVLDVHWYPEAQGDGKRIAFSNDTETRGVHAARIQAPRSLWDPTYVETSWITKDSLKGKPIALLPRLTAQIRKHYPGTALAITEYNYGGGKHVSGMLAQAEVLGLFGRYGVFAACNWGMGKDDVAQLAGFKAFIDYDGKGSRFFERGLAVNGGNPTLNSVFASTGHRTQNSTTVVAINKTQEPMVMRFSIRNRKIDNGSAFTRQSPDFQKVISQRLASSSGRIAYSAPPLSITTFRLDH